MARTFQNIRLFKTLSVLDNVRIAGDINDNHGLDRFRAARAVFSRVGKAEL